MTISLDESLFGVRDFGEMTLLELATLYRETLNSFFTSDAVSYPIDNIEWLFYRIYIGGLDEPTLKKIKEMHTIRHNTNHKYGVKFEIVLCGNYNWFEPRMLQFYINVWIDGVEINKMLWDHNLQSYQTWGGIHLLNDAHEKYLHSLHYAEFRANMDRITEELISTAMHPRRLIRHLELGGEIEDF